MSQNTQIKLSPQQLNKNRQDFLDILQNTQRLPLPKQFYCFLDSGDFWTAPASTRFHDSHEGGLVVHSLKVYEHLTILNYQQMLGFSEDSIAKTALFHDICKINFYKKSYRNKRLEDGRWIRMESYDIDDELPLGHGEKSVAILLAHQVPLTQEEMLAIRWHMGGFDASARDYAAGMALSSAMSKSKLVTALHLADMMATWL